ncbi:MAG: hypothetical protein J4N92_09635 [Chloroflexi bacterium]|nr:hypothetical protein [Chloroflexota bacterium]
MPEEKRFVTMLGGWFDDSGRRDGEFPISVVGGFVAHPTQWVGFNHRWKEILDKYDVEIHHQNRWSNGAKPFDKETWKFYSQRQDYINELLNLICSVSAVSIAAAVPHHRMDAQFPNWRKYTTPFGFAAQLVFSAAIDKARESFPDARIAYVFESGSEGYPEVERSFQECHSKPHIRDEFGLISLTDMDKRKDMRLQAADILAYEVYKLYQKGDNPNSTTFKARYPLRVISNKMPGVWTTPSDEMVHYSAQLRDLGEALDELIALRKKGGLPA